MLYIAFVESANDFANQPINPDDVASCNIICSVESQDDFLRTLLSGEQAREQLEEFRQDMSVVFNSLVKTFVEHGIITNAGKLNLSGYTMASYLEFSVKVARELFDKMKEDERNELNRVNTFQKRLPEIKNKLKLSTNSEEKELLERDISEMEEFINKDRMSGLSKKGRDMALSAVITGISTGLRIMEKGKTFEFDYKAVLESWKPSGDLLLKWILKGLENDVTFSSMVKNYEQHESII